MQQALLDHLRVVTEEEQRILDGVAEVDKDLYTSGKDFTVDSAKMLSEGKLIAVRTHTRFVHFPSHRHNYIEVLYVCQGQLTNIIGAGILSEVYCNPVIMKILIQNLKIF